MIRPTSARLPILASLALAAASSAFAQQPTFTPYHANGIYNAGEKVGWTVALPPGTAAPPGPYAYAYAVRKNNFGDPIKTGTLDLSRGPATIEVTLDEPAMLYVQITPPPGAAGAPPARGGGRGGLALGAAAAPTRLRPAAARPADSHAFRAATVKAWH